MTLAVHLPNKRQDILIASAVFGLIGAVLIALAPARIMSGYGDIHQSLGRADSAMLVQFGANPLYQPVNRTWIIQKIINTSADSYS